MRLSIILGVGLLLFIAGGIFMERHMQSSARSLGRLLSAAEEETRRGRAETALTLLRRFERRWSNLERTWALITDHHEMDQVKIATDRADRFLAVKALPDAQAELASLRFLIEHIPKKESIGLTSVF